MERGRKDAIINNISAIEEVNNMRVVTKKKKERERRLLRGHLKKRDCLL